MYRFRNLGLFSIIMMILSLIPYAQDSKQKEARLYENNAYQWSQSLAGQLKLNTSQRNSIRAILMDYQRQRQALKDIDEGKINEFNQTFNSRIRGMMKDSQVNSFYTYSETWWNDINTSISNTDQISDQDNQKQ